MTADGIALPGILRRAPARALIFCIELYRTYVSPTRMPTCRFTPTCSEYAVDALRQRGAVIGLALTVARLLKCGPWHRGGWDPVPSRGFRHRDLPGAATPGGPEGPAAAPDTGKQPHDRVNVGEQRST
ncbi:membrane protein insertion efficiency factor YidD [Rhodococcus sp. NPDC003318]|uniref:membrane protein insertion efficiency factor YidD n=1 Tax=Rhodococcus sp. NPDC003318 TaxID=3364503 RepID=UPI00368173D6